MKRFYSQKPALVNAMQPKARSTRQVLSKEDYEKTKTLAERLDKCVSTTTDKAWYRAAHERFDKLTSTVSLQDDGFAGCVANTVRRTLNNDKGVVAFCSQKQSWIIAMWCVKNNVSL